MSFLQKQTSSYCTLINKFYFENERPKEIEDDGPTETIGLAE